MPGAFGTLAESLLALASVVDVATGKLRLQLADEMPALEHQPAEDATGKRGKTKAGAA